MKLSSRKHRLLSLALPLVPAFFVMEHVGPEGFPEAQGCSGAGAGGAVAPAQTATIHRLTGAGEVEVATDGFFLIDSYSFTGYDPGNITVTVTTLEGAEVLGAVKVLTTSGGQSLYSWSANEPLEVGSKLRASVAPTFSAFGAPDQAILAVVAVPAELASGGVNVENWLDFGHGVGPSTTCFASGGSCTGPHQISLPGAEQMLHAANYGWSPAAAVTGFVAWEVTVERASVAAPEMALAAPGASLFMGGPNAHLYLGALPFPLGTERYCVKYTVRDLRTDDSESAEFCSELGPSTETQRDYPLAQCDQPPSAELTKAWCELHPGSTLAQCVPFDPTAHPADPQDPMPREPSDDVTPRAEPSDDDRAAGSRTSSGCQMTTSASRHAGFGLFLAATVLGGWLRRRRGSR